MSLTDSRQSSGGVQDLLRQLTAMIDGGGGVGAGSQHGAAAAAAPHSPQLGAPLQAMALVRRCFDREDQPHEHEHEHEGAAADAAGWARCFGAAVAALATACV
jgi:hypothetical protein